MSNSGNKKTEMLKAIIIDWAFILIAFFLVSLVVYTFNLIFIEIDVIRCFTACLDFVERHFYAITLLVVVLMVASVKAYLNMRTRK